MKNYKKKRKILESDSYNTRKVKIFDQYEPQICKKCNTTFDKKTLFKAHVKSHEFDDHTYDSKSESSPDKFKPYVCSICEKKFTVKKNLMKHLRLIHKNPCEAEKLKVKKTKCPQADCLFACHKMKDLRNHIEKYHQTKILRDTLQFTDETGFMKWKKEEEDKSVASFISYRGKVILRNGITKRVLCCHRTGTYNPKGTGKHRLKSHGSCKMGGTCPAAMEIVHCTDGQILVTYYKTHLGHSQDVVHLPISKEEKEKLSERINQGFSLDAILEDVKDSIDPKMGKTKRIHMLSRKDLYNIVKSNCVKKTKTDETKSGIDDLPAKEIINSNGNMVSFGRMEKRSLAEGEARGNEPNPSNFPSLVKSSVHCSLVNVEPNAVLTDSLPLANGSPATNPTCGISTVTAAAQLVVLSPSGDPRPTARLILVQPTENGIDPRHSPEEAAIEPKTVTLPDSARGGVPACGITKEPEAPSWDSVGEKSPFVIALRDKLEKINRLLPGSELLTPKQFEMINSKLDSIINLFGTASIKAKAKGKMKKVGSGDLTGNLSQQQKACEPNLYTYVYSYS